MPHYKDGVMAKVGDIVRGATYNRGGKVEDGIIAEITSTADTCNCRVAFLTMGEGGPSSVEFDHAEIRALEKIGHVKAIGCPEGDNEPFDEGVM